MEQLTSFDGKKEWQVEGKTIIVRKQTEAEKAETKLTGKCTGCIHSGNEVACHSAIPNCACDFQESYIILVEKPVEENEKN